MLDLGGIPANFEVYNGEEEEQREEIIESTFSSGKVGEMFCLIFGGWQSEASKSIVRVFLDGQQIYFWCSVLVLSFRID